MNTLETEKGYLMALEDMRTTLNELSKIHQKEPVTTERVGKTEALVEFSKELQKLIAEADTRFDGVMNDMEVSL